MEKKYRSLEYEDERHRPFGLLLLNLPVFRPYSFLDSHHYLRRAQKRFLLALRDFIDADLKRFND